MSRLKKVKNFKITLQSLDINKLYIVLEYVTISTEFFKELDSYINEYSDSINEDSEYYFTKKVIYLYDSMKDKLKVK